MWLSTCGLSHSAPALINGRSSFLGQSRACFADRRPYAGGDTLAPTALARVPRPRRPGTNRGAAQRMHASPGLPNK
eukprot:5137388-Alexandrium_andersonii.AAC.1